MASTASFIAFSFSSPREHIAIHAPSRIFRKNRKLIEMLALQNQNHNV
jgi:hypothetical protein